jgi:hypothetical protein
MLLIGPVAGGTGGAGAGALGPSTVIVKPPPSLLDLDDEDSERQQHVAHNLTNQIANSKRY